MSDPDPNDYRDLALRHARLDAYAWARETLEGIADTIDRTGRVTRKQQEAIEHIIIGRLKHDHV